MTELVYQSTDQFRARRGGQPALAGAHVRVATGLACYGQTMSIEETVQQ